MKRRKFIQNSGLLGLGLTASLEIYPQSFLKHSNMIKNYPVAVATWNFQNATKMAGTMLSNGATALDAVEKGVMVEEANLKNTTVGNGGAPDRDGNVTLDACIMSPAGDAGAVVYLKEIEHPVSVARRVMEKTPHVMLAGEGALQFAIQEGFQKKNLLTEESEKAWKKWLEHKEYKPIINIENHDTIGMLCMDENGDIAAACTTSGLSYKMNGRVGDSPIIGAGLFIDNEVGGAVGTGMGEAIMKSVGSFLIVELMRNGMSPQEACKETVMRTIRKDPKYKKFQVAYVAMNKQGEIGSYCIHKGFSYAKFHNGESSDNLSESYLKG
ncbi:isoaspartyl peptidase/L-asparaginase family protein [Christiangramia salexigens]|uniref:Glycosylasparaginase n=1 Tax=Christiangramia salexigens TaxID=1913577 RepID=A0A1L3J8G4_9FLAO|nr:N(4)-(beta-N-acetylglucosaminyl)-L-asparaginase [Christiangramia salexigens]APG61432.1 glycosylasparaginase [Christiangramia salexigens]